MSVLRVTDGPPLAAGIFFRLGAGLAKQADDAPEVAYNLAGRLYLSSSGWLLLSVPNALVRGAFQAMAEPGIELPPAGPDGQFSAHISVCSPDEIEQIGGPDKITERGKQYHYTLGRIFSFTPAGWPGIDRVWVFRVHSPEMQDLRRSYGLPGLPHSGEHPFHITIAVLRRGTLGRNEKSKAD